MLIDNNVYDNEINDVKTRSSHVEEMIAQMEEQSGSCLADYDAEITQAELERIGTYLLTSKDIESNREGEYTYYLDERDYRSHYAIGKNSMSVDPIEDSELFGMYEPEDVIAITTPENFRKILGRMGVSNFRELLIHWREIRDRLSDEVDLTLWNELIESMIANSSEKEFELIISLITGHTIEDSAKSLGITRQAAFNRLKKLARKIKVLSF